MLIVDAF